MKRLAGTVLFLLLAVFCAWHVSGAQATPNSMSVMPLTSGQHNHDAIVKNGQAKLWGRQPKLPANQAKSHDGTPCFPKLRAYTVGMQAETVDAMNQNADAARLGCNPAGALRLQPAPLTGKLLLIGPTALRAPAIDPTPKP